MLEGPIGKVTVGAAIEASKRAYAWLRDRGTLFPERHYLGHISKSLEEMPFIYDERLRLNVLTDFVSPSGAAALSALGAHRQTIVLGAAGMGKTTLCRYAIQTIASSTDLKEKQIFPESGLIPFYVPLKLVRNDSPSPILSWLIDNAEILKRAGGLSKLRSLVRSRRAAFFLDGYDEVPYAGEIDYIRRELEAFLSGPGFANQYISSEYRDIYDPISRCRTWITTRPDFLELYPIKKSALCSIYSCAGLTTNQVVLVKKIFDYYRRDPASDFADTLSEEKFLRDLSVYGNRGIEYVAKSPLFLTILCFNYASYKKDGLNTDDVFRSGGDELIRKCVDLLLHKLDRQKTKEIPIAQREPFMERRSASYPEKKNFLRHFALLTYIFSIREFSRDILVREAKKFFSDDSEESQVIRRGLDRANLEANLVEQIIQSNIFTRTGLRGAGADPMYDFPHRRFRELLACDHIDSNSEAASSVLLNVGNPSYAELVLVASSISIRKEEILNALGDAVITAPDTKKRHALLTLFEKCVVSIEDKEKRSRLVAKLVVSLSRLALGAGELQKALYAYIDPKFVDSYQSLLSALEDTVRAKNRIGLATILPPMRHLYASDTNVRVCQLLGEVPLEEPFFWDLLSYSTPLSQPMAEVCAKRLRISGAEDGKPLGDAQKFLARTFFGQSLTDARVVFDSLIAYSREHPDVKPLVSKLEESLTPGGSKQTPSLPKGWEMEPYVATAIWQ